MILCDTEIRAALDSGQLVIDPRPPDANIQPSAVDLLLGAGFSRWKVPEGPGFNYDVDPSAEQFYTHFARQYQEIIPPDADGSVVLKPGGFILALTRERVSFPPASRLAARVEGRSSLARIGMGVHLTAPTIHATFRGRITLEITNQGPIPIRLRPGLKICQLIIEMVFGTPSAEMVSAFQDQDHVGGRDPDPTSQKPVQE